MLDSQQREQNFQQIGRNLTGWVQIPEGPPMWMRGQARNKGRRLWKQPEAFKVLTLLSPEASKPVATKAGSPYSLTGEIRLGSKD